MDNDEVISLSIGGSGRQAWNRIDDYRNSRVQHSLGRFYFAKYILIMIAVSLGGPVMPLSHKVI